jgi:uncharacterized protein RhaS with RHS repeats
MLNDDAINNAPDVYERPRDIGIRGGGSCEQWHRGCPVAAVQGDVLDNELAFGDQMVIFDSDVRAKVVFDDRRDLLQPVTALGSGRMIHQITGNQFVKGRVITT